MSGGGRGTELDPEDELSGRAGLWLAIDTLQPGDRLLVYKRDRLARSVYAMEWIRRAVAKRGAAIESLQGMNGDTDEEILVQHILAAASEYERRMVKARTRDGMARLRAEGRYCGAHAPYGSKVEKRGKHKFTAPEPSELALIEQMQLLAANGLGVRRIARELNQAGLRCRGRLWEATSIRRILKREGGK